MSDQTHLTVDKARGRDDELFTTPSTDPTPDRHPSILRPGGHTSPLKHPAALRPGAARISRTPSPNNGTPTSPTAKASRASPSPIAYKAYSPPRLQSPSDELSAEIEGYFTALEVSPLRISKTPELQPVAAPPLPPKEQHEVTLSPEQRCASPPIPPKEIILPEERQAASPFASELEDPSSPVSELEAPLKTLDNHAKSDEAEAPPPYEASQSITAPPEKGQFISASPKGSPVGVTAASAAHVGGVMAGVPVAEAIANSSAAVAAVSAEVPQSSKQNPAEDDEDEIYSAGPPPLPPRRPSPSSGGKGKESVMPGAFPPPPARPMPPYKASGAAATSAAGVGGSIAGVGQSAGLKQARKALEKGLGHLIDKAKEHHHAREQQQAHEKKTSGNKKSAEDKRKSAESSGNVAQVSGAHAPWGLGVDADLYY